MPKRENIRQLLGLTQEMLAIELQITRSQLSMYELGKRDLPANAKLKLAEMIENAKHFKINNNISKEEHQIIINDLLFVNKRKRINLENTILTLNNKIKKTENKIYLNKSKSNEDFKIILQKLLLEYNKLILKNELLIEEEKNLKKYLKRNL
jgi:transcriptional regulator with XRE-family HTH domain